MVLFLATLLCGNTVDSAVWVSLESALNRVRRTATARGKAEMADMAADHAREDSDIARATAKQFAPDFQQPGNAPILRPKINRLRMWLWNVLLALETCRRLYAKFKLCELPAYRQSEVDVFHVCEQRIVCQRMCIFIHIQGVSEEIVNILGGVSMDYSE